MNYHNITKDDMLNGEGLRVVLWVSGCSHACPGCQNQQTWNPKSGIPFDEAAKQELFEQLSKDYISGITLSGGDPLYLGNRAVIAELIAEIREKFPTKTIWMYTGYPWEDIIDLPMVWQCDVVVEGEYVEAERDTKLHWRGSSNQRVIDVKRTKPTDKIPYLKTRRREV